MEINTKEQLLIGLCINGNSFSLWSTDLHSVNVSGPRPEPVVK